MTFNIPIALNQAVNKAGSGALTLSIVSDLAEGIPQDERGELFFHLSEHYCRYGFEFQSLFDLAQHHGIHDYDSGGHDAARLPYLFLNGEFKSVVDGMWRVSCQKTVPWSWAAPIAWTVRNMAFSKSVPGSLSQGMIRGFTEFCKMQCENKSLIMHSEEIIKTAADMAGHRVLPNGDWERSCVSFFGLSVVFWEQFRINLKNVSYLGKVENLTGHFRWRLFCQNYKILLAANRQFASIKRSENPTDILKAVAFFEDLGNVDALRFRREFISKNQGALLAIHPTNYLDDLENNKLTLVSKNEGLEAACRAEVSVVSVMRNERFMLPHFLDHYRKIGVTSFLIADNNSNDGTREYLLRQSDVVLFSAEGEYKKSQYGVAWQQAMMGAFRRGKWSLVADADELLVWQNPQTDSLSHLLSLDEFQRVDAARIFMLDLYPEGNIERADFAKGTPFDQACFCDKVPLLSTAMQGCPFTGSPNWVSAARHRVFPGMAPSAFTSQKIALLRYQPWMQFLPGMHYLGGARISSRELIFSHFKYNAQFWEKAQIEAAREQHYGNALEYKKYLTLGDSLYDPSVSVFWLDSPFVRALMND